MTVHTQRGKTSSAKQNSRRKEQLSERDRLVLKEIVISKKRTTVAKVTADLAQSTCFSPFSNITVRLHLLKQNMYGRAATSKPLVTEFNTKRRLQWCLIYKICSDD
ncbi:hypothetical protein TNCV_2118851 [Trichonephila clavipes]|nr:hypothetical protein TNCV_2118851 [Trichonephila clavipes]